MKKLFDRAVSCGARPLKMMTAGIVPYPLLTSISRIRGRLLFIETLNVSRDASEYGKIRILKYVSAALMFKSRIGHGPLHELIMRMSVIIAITN